METTQLDLLIPKVLNSQDATVQALVAARDTNGLANYLNGASGENGWRTDARVNAILDAINWAAYTPTDNPQNSDTDLAALSIKTARLLTAQTKQINLQLMLQGRDTLDCSRPNVRGGLRDCVIKVPTGASGAETAPGGASGANVLAQCVRPITRAESMAAASSQASDTTGTVTARVLTVQGLLDGNDTSYILFNPNGTPRQP